MAKKEYDIIEYIDKKSQIKSIKSLKRISDGVVFTIGDKVSFDWLKTDHYYTITGIFKIGNYFEFEHKEIGNGKNPIFNKLSHYKGNIENFIKCRNDAGLKLIFNK